MSSTNERDPGVDTYEALLSVPLTRGDVIRRGVLGAGVLFGGGSLLAACGGDDSTPSAAATTGAKKLTGPLNVIAWDGYDNPEVVRGFEEKYGVQLNVKIAGGNPQQVAAVRAANIEWDVANPDNDYVQRLAKADLIQPLDRGDYENLDSMFETFRNFAPHQYEGTLYGVPVRWGINGIVHWPNKLSVADAEDGYVLWEDRFRGRVDAIDWYDLNILLTVLYAGNKEPWTAKGRELDAAIDKLIELKPNLRSLATSLGDIKTDIANKDAWIVWGASSNDTAIGLKEDGHAVELTIPKQGGAVWTEALVITKNTKHPETAKAYLNYMTSPEVQAKLAWNDAFKVGVCNEKATAILTAEQVKILNLDKASEWLSRDNIVLSQSPVANAEWERGWERFKSA
jgi:spermidine/putrescine-binding protein